MRPLCLGPHDLESQITDQIILMKSLVISFHKTNHIHCVSVSDKYKFGILGKSKKKNGESLQYSCKFL